jgi:hypothetical protein
MSKTPIDTPVEHEHHAEQKLPYEAPALRFRGTIAELTQGEGGDFTEDGDGDFSTKSV